jgi:hypothetical protein
MFLQALCVLLARMKRATSVKMMPDSIVGRAENAVYQEEITVATRVARVEEIAARARIDSRIGPT